LVTLSVLPFDQNWQEFVNQSWPKATHKKKVWCGPREHSSLLSLCLIKTLRNDSTLEPGSSLQIFQWVPDHTPLTPANEILCCCSFVVLGIETRALYMQESALSFELYP
jgi:hypothetical protein